MYVQMLSVMLLCFLSTGHIEGLPLEGKEKPKPINIFILVGLLEPINGPHWISADSWLFFFFFVFFPQKFNNF